MLNIMDFWNEDYTFPKQASDSDNRVSSVGGICWELFLPIATVLDNDFPLCWGRDTILLVVAGFYYRCADNSLQLGHYKQHKLFCYLTHS